MSDRRSPPRGGLPARVTERGAAPILRDGEAPPVSGEFRLDPALETPPAHAQGERPRRRTSHEAMQAVRPPEPKRYPTVELEAWRPGGRMLDDELAYDLEDSFALDIPLADAPSSRRSDPDLGWRASPAPPSSPTPRSVPRAPYAGARSSSTMHAVSPPVAPPLAGGEMVGSQAESPVRRISSGSIEAVDPHDRLLAFAKFGELPRTIWGAPLYALRVHRRRRTLQRELDDARRRRSPDVALYEAALRTADMPTVHVGISVAVAIAVLAVPLVIGIVQVVLGELASR